MLRLSTLLCVVALFHVAFPEATEYRTLDGSGNNLLNRTLGMAQLPYKRCPVCYDFGDGLNSPAGATRPSPRNISNFLAGRWGPLDGRMNDMHTQWGGVLSVEFALRGTNNTSPNAFTIRHPLCDEFKDPLCLGNATQAFFRDRFVGGVTTPRNSINTVTPWFDASFIYGESNASLPLYRAFFNGTMHANYSKLRMPVNVNPQVPAISYVLVLEHNRLAHQFSLQHPSWDDEKLFQEARRWIIAFVQKISFREYLAPVLGEPLPPYKGYDPTVDPTTDIFFATVAFRYGHSEVTPHIPRVDENYNPIPAGHKLLRECWSSGFNTKCNDNGLAPMMRGMIVNEMGKSGCRFADDMRNWAFFTRSILSGRDMLALDIQRGRDNGIPDYNTMREVYGLERKSNFSEVTSDTVLANLLSTIYGGDIDNVDAYVGGLAEDHMPNALVGELFWHAIRNQFLAYRDGDRFWYENNQFTPDELGEIYGTTYAMILERNMNMSNLPQNVFFIRERQLNATTAPLFSFDTTYKKYIDLSTSYRLSWFIEDDEIQFKLEAATTGWIGVGFSPDLNTMKNADIYIGWVDIDESGVQHAHMLDCYALDVGVPKQDVLDLNSTNDILWVRGTEINGITTLEFRRKLVTGDPYDKPILDAPLKSIFAFNPDTDLLKYHGPTRSATTLINYRYKDDIKELTQYPMGIRIALGVLIALGAVLVIVLIVFIVMFRTRFRFYTPIFCVLIALGGLVGYFYVLTLIVEPTDSSCVAQVWLICFAFTIMFGSLFIKTWRIWRISEESQKLRRVRITDFYLLKMVAVLLLVETVFLIIWSTVDAPKIVKVDDPLETDTLKYICESESAVFTAITIAAKAIMLCIGVVLTWRVRNVPPEVNESKTIGVAIYTVALICLIAMPLNFILYSIPVAAIAIKGFAVWLVVTSSLLLLFVPKMLNDDGEDDDVTTHSATEMRRADSSSAMTSNNNKAPAITSERHD